MRSRFDQNKDLNDIRKARELLVSGERELFEKQHYQPKKCELFPKLEEFLIIMCVLFSFSR